MSFVRQCCVELLKDFLHTQPFDSFKVRYSMKRKTAEASVIKELPKIVANKLTISAVNVSPVFLQHK